MHHNSTMKLRVASRRDFDTPLRLLFMLVMLAAVMSPQPVILMLLAIFIFGTMWLARVTGFSKADDAELISVIFPDGSVRLEFDCGETVEGFLEGQQWLAGQLAVLRVVIAGSNRKLIILSAQQSAAEDFRRLNVWLRQASWVAA